MDRMTREQMIAEFGEPGVQNAKVVDLIAPDKAGRVVVLTMVERRAWGADPQQFRQIEEKINRYLAYVLDGHLWTQYPTYQGWGARILLECAEEPHGEAARFVEAAGRAIAASGLEFLVRVGAPASGLAHGA